MRIAFIGGGNMAAALIGGLSQRSAGDLRISVVDPSEQQREALASRYGARCWPQACADALDADVLVFAVKPQQMREAALACAPHVSGKLAISVAAGIRAADLSRWLGGHGRIVRAMPNTPALIGMGVTGLAAMPGLAEADRETADRVLAAVGQTVWVADESLLDAVTALSGSGPAYVFLFMESLIRGGVELGLDEDQARRLTLATFAGAAQLALNSDEPPAVLRERVTSKGGTTFAALEAMRARGVPEAIVQAARAARDRGAEMGDEFGRG